MKGSLGDHSVQCGGVSMWLQLCGLCSSLWGLLNVLAGAVSSSICSTGSCCGVQDLPRAESVPKLTRKFSVHLHLQLVYCLDL